ncbi:MAG: alpha/beta fold hydrolase [Myxococcota bacterium]
MGASPMSRDVQKTKRAGPPATLEERFIETRDGHRLFVTQWRPRRPKGVPLVLTDGLGCEGYAWSYLIDYFKGERPLVAWQYRGHGRSPVPEDLDCLTIPNMVRDLEDVLTTTNTHEAVFLGYSMGVQILLEAVRSLRERVRGLVLVCGSYERPIDNWHNAPERYRAPTIANRLMRRVFPYLSGAFLHFPDPAHRVWRSVVPTRLSYEVAVRTEVNGRRIDRRDFSPYLDHIGTMDMRVFAALARALAVHSAADLLPTLTCPTLIIAGQRDTFAPVWLSEEMHRQVPDSELMVVRDGTHATPVEHPQLLNLRLEKFLRERVERNVRGGRRRNNNLAPSVNVSPRSRSESH